MPFIYITGSAGSGKTTLQRELIRRGYEAHDEDDPDVGSAHNKQSNLPVSVPPVDQRTPEWFARHEWRVFPTALQDLKDRSRTKTVYLCGNVATEDQLQQVFDTVVFLHIDEQTLRHRVTSRKDNDFGQSEHEVQLILKRDATARELHTRIHSQFIDATQPIDAVLDQILAIASKFKPTKIGR